MTAFNDKLLTNLDKLILYEITRLYSIKKECFASNSYFSKMFSCSIVSVSRSISKLIKNDYIKNIGENKYIRLLESTEKILINNEFIIGINTQDNSINIDVNSINTQVNLINTRVDYSEKELIAINSCVNTELTCGLIGINLCVNIDIEELVKSISKEESIYKKENIKEKKVSSQKENINKKEYGEFKNILLTDEEYQKLFNIYFEKLDDAINYLSSSIESKGYKYKNHYAVMCCKTKWVYKEIIEKVNGNSRIPTKKDNIESNDDVFKNYLNKQKD